MGGVKRVFVEKRPGFDVVSSHLMQELATNLKIDNINKVRILNRYDVSGIEDDVFNQAVISVFSENNQDHVHLDGVELGSNVFGVEYLPGQYDQRADSAAQCIQILSSGERPVVKYAKIIDIEGNISQEDLKRIKDYLINPVDSREAAMEMPVSLEDIYPEPPDVAVCEGFIGYSEDEVEGYRIEMGFAMSREDLLFCQKYFRDEEKRNPTVTELKVIDTYWSDHCRHTTFLTEFDNIEFEDGIISADIKNTYDRYVDIRKEVYGDRIQEKEECLMDIAVLAMKHLRKAGKLEDLEVSSEINACSIEVDADVDGKTEKWLVMFKNETHNHPTEIEPFGGAATCLGGAIRDPLSGRSYVYQAMRVTGSGDPTVDLSETLPGKLPQVKITTEAAHGYSSYGNQIGLATGKVEEIYHDDYRAKRMEIGAVIAAAPKENVVRLESDPGDIIILVGGRTGRDGCGGATGSSKEHDEESILVCGSEVQKGNAPEERKIQRLFRNDKLSKMIKKCNDFGAGGVSVAIGELADSLDIDLDKVLKKYDGLDGTELAISESQERMAVVVDEKNVDRFIELAYKENLETAIVAKVTDTGRLVMKWRGDAILDISRDFLETNGVKQKCDIYVSEPSEKAETETRSIDCDNDDLKNAWIDNLRKLNNASQKGLVERFDSTVGAGTVLMPFGGKYQLTPTEGMSAKLPVLGGNTDTCTLMAHGFDPDLSKWSPYHGAQYAVIHSLAKIVAMGGDYSKVRLTLQEYFEKLNKEKKRWGKPFTALLGAFKAQTELDIPAIGGKDSMSGTFKDMDVPPTLVSFAVTHAKASKVISPEFKKAGSYIAAVKIKQDENGLPVYEDIRNKYKRIAELVEKGSILSAHTIGKGGLGAAISKMAFGNKIGALCKFNTDLNSLFEPSYGSLVLEVESLDNLEGLEHVSIGKTIEEEIIKINCVEIEIDEMIEAWMKPLDNVFPAKEDIDGGVKEFKYTKGTVITGKGGIAKPKVFIPVFPGSNCEYDTAKAFERAGGEAEIFVFKNFNSISIDESIKEMAEKIKQSQIIAIPGGFSAGDEPEGSGKFITSVFRNPMLKEAVMDLLKNRDGLMLGICNGFQALIKLGLVQYGEIRDLEIDSPTLSYNKIGRHISTFVNTKITSNLSPWYSNCKVGDLHAIPVSHGEGRFIATEEWISKLETAGQIATQYVDVNGQPTYDGFANPNGSVEAIEGITSPDGRVLGKMGHSERIGDNLHINIPGNKDQKIFEAGIDYFK
ncbi:phosphoribosylformylglycinamidine synthase [Dethiosulfatibacter aminovorans DSM 17477]|uniref:Phosphoribosylformylglycinamidine synthase n=1 Tax=Dethiosulfatibacter aminovorans DSM 17477 TaxID=1121476 RepID=A0A1M6FN71_9FIRM|nr:phosphoribosylformylglycinamidine synthase [Dethiosulfatibacter aminovorans]SHI99161.1 phosphoribosylformylglycinamidine synthase [Dethiosulfatibacter aminovorans DSM 17477]